MAERRMFAKTIIDSDAFLDMPLSTQSLYFHLSMRADDDGFINNPKKIQRMIGATEDDLRLLIAKSFIITFESGIVVIKHWKIHNYLRADRKKATVYPDEMALLSIKENGSYTLRKDLPKIECQSSDSQVTVSCQSCDSIGEDRIGEDRKGKNKRKTFSPPSLEEVRSYCQERGNHVDPESFIDFYESKGWMIGKNKMKDWKACVRTWERKEKKTSTFNNHPAREVDMDELEKVLLETN